MRRAARVDSTQADIVAALRAMGAVVYLIKEPIDLLVGFRGITLVVEVKNLKGRGKRFTPQQVDFFKDWKGGPVATVCDVEGAIRLLKTVEAA